jgi:hypothetical protein
MLYTIDITIPANTPKESPIEEKVLIKSGVIRKISILIPSGHFCLAHLVIKDGETQIVPHEGDIHGDGETLEFEDWIQIEEPERIITFCGWNEDTTFSHTFYVRIIVLPIWLAAPHIWLIDKINSILRILRIPQLLGM